MDINQNSSIYTVLAAARKLKKCEQLNFLISFLNKWGICVHYEKDDETDMSFSRLIITAKRGQADYRNMLTWKCGGLVVNENLRPISVPPKSHDIKYNLETIAKNLKEYEVSAIQDGTIITLYNWKDEWNMSSMNGFDIRSYRRNTTKTFMEAFKECAAKYPQFNMEKLDKNCSYSIGFSHPEMHPSVEHHKLWLICVHDISNDTPAELQYPEIMGVRKQNALSIKMIDELEEFSRAPYGYVLRSRRHKDIIIESPLMVNIRKLLYHDPIEHREFMTYLQHNDPEWFGENRLRFMIIRAYLDNRRRNKFRMLFPQYNSQMDEFAKFANDVAKYTVAGIVSPTAAGVGKQMIAEAIVVGPARDLAKKFITHLKKKEPINANSKDGRQIVEDLVLDSKYAEDYFHAFQKSKK